MLECRDEGGWEILVEVVPACNADDVLGGEQYEAKSSRQGPE